LENLGEMYELGHGVPKDEKAAAEWYRKAFAAGSPSALLALARLHAEGRGVTKNEAEARALLRKAAKAPEVNQVWGAFEWFFEFSDFGLARPPYQTVTLMLLTLAEEPRHRELLIADANNIPEVVRITLQKRLKQDGHYRGPLNGTFGPDMKVALDTWAAAQRG